MPYGLPRMARVGPDEAANRAGMGVRRLLIYFAGIGDLVLLVPLFRSLADEGELELLTRPYGRPLFAAQPFVGSTHVLQHPNRGRRGLARFLAGGERRRLGPVLARCGYDEIMVFGQERKVITNWVHGWRGQTPLRVMQYPEGHPDRLRTGFQSLGMDRDAAEPFPRLCVDGDARRAARSRVAELGHRVIGVQLGSGPVNVRWRRRPDVKGLRPEQWGGLIKHVLERGDADAVVFNGTGHETRDVRAVVARVPAEHRGCLHDWTGRTRLDELPAILSAYEAFISTDTGPAHIAAAVGCPLLVFFGPSDPAAYLMRGAGPTEMVLGAAPCQFCAGTPLFKRCRDNVCLNRLDVGVLVEGWQRLWARIADARTECVDRS